MEDCGMTLVWTRRRAAMFCVNLSTVVFGPFAALKAWRLVLCVSPLALGVPSALLVYLICLEQVRGMAGGSAIGVPLLMVILTSLIVWVWRDGLSVGSAKFNGSH
jgi:hypothetical protein